MELFSLEDFDVLLSLAGLAMLLGALLPQFIFKRHVTLALIHLVAGALFFYFFDIGIPDPLQEGSRKLWVRLSEFIVILSLMGAGLKIESSLHSGWWKLTARLLLITMPLTIGLATLLGYFWLGLPLAAALLLGAVLAPTDPVLAADVQLGPPLKVEEDDPTRFTLTAEAGLNDGLAFPFTYLAIAFMLYVNGENTAENWLLDWAWKAIAYKIVIGVLAGFVIGKLLARLIFNYPKEKPLSMEGMSFIVLCVLFLSYGLTELLAGYGFLAVFVASYVFRREEYRHEFNLVLHEFAENLERALVSLFLLPVGGLLIFTLPFFTWPMLVFAIVFMLLVRPLAAGLGMLGYKLPAKSKKVIALYGIRGIGSIYYLAYAFDKANFVKQNQLWAIVLLVIALSCILHGLTAYPIMQFHDKKVKNQPEGEN